ncbi:uncharacterized protein K452DRAFT_259629 [Aplosporella prunicola CBS 121167]|uniref:DUF221-domain-containing protein n=1 Tax=Aplosporella prunicola CBS 121167 TaxID=1176127 RepID=A0A6A6AVS8_9PEZI|nr:uncharacterized protein K452DRAFT_259629 [Aplosporella prunicola CBS 121167]KAF2136112.1 hypothetical protein K452DRAFT_259629 [Aplosporella prunicola CBS 121167]
MDGELHSPSNNTSGLDLFGTRRPRDTTIQIIISIALGTSAFLAFCILRPRWEGLYAARKKQKGEATALPELPRSLFGWIPVLFRITEEQVLASAGLDAYVFLAFFKMAIKFLSITLFFSLVVIKPVHDRFPDTSKSTLKPNNTISDDSPTELRRRFLLSERSESWNSTEVSHDPWSSHYFPEIYQTDYLWMYLVFAYLFTGLAMYLIVSETRKIIEVRQEYLGSQTTITDRTIRLSGIPPELRTESKIKDFVEALEIGKVERVTLCRNWKELDDLMVKRMAMLRKLEEAWTVHLGARRVERNMESLPISQPSPPGPAIDGGEHSRLLESGENGHVMPYARNRPITKIWYGRFKLRYKNVDAIDYYEEKLRRMDEQIKALRKKEFEPTPLAFVTMDTVASCQMAVQAVLDPSPLQLLAKTSPSPTDVVWPNTYMPRRERMIRAWSITAMITVLTVFWTLMLVPIAGALSLESIGKVWPRLSEMLEYHKNIRSIVTTQLPTLFVSLLNVTVPYIYDYLSNLQGMMGQGDVELSVISKNFFFVFFNFFVVFTILGTASGFIELLEHIGEQLRDATKITNALAVSLQGLLNFYANFVILQGLGLFPLRLLEFGSVALYPIHLMGAKTPRDYAELVQPPVFSYGFYLPQTILIFIICTVYSVLRSSWMVLLAGLAYFMMGHFVHKYQLLYAMDHRQHSTGRGWTMICDRVILGLILFQLTMAGQLALKRAFWRSALLVPLILGTLWFLQVYSKTYRPLMKFIALKSLRRAEHSESGMPGHTGEGPEVPETTVDEARERGTRFINPSLILPLEDVWIADKAARSLSNGRERN